MSCIVVQKYGKKMAFSPPYTNFNLPRDYYTNFSLLRSLKIGDGSEILK